MCLLTSVLAINDPRSFPKKRANSSLIKVGFSNPDGLDLAFFFFLEDLSAFLETRDEILAMFLTLLFKAFPEFTQRSYSPGYSKIKFTPLDILSPGMLNGYIRNVKGSRNSFNNF